MFFLLLSLLAGVLTVLAPCTISLLPVIVGGSIDRGGYKHALTVVVSLGISVIAFTLLLKVSSSLVSIPQEVWQWISGGIIFALGLTMVFPVLWERLSLVGAMNRSSNRLLAVGYQKKGFLGDVLMGAALGPVFSSCSPTYFLILASVLPHALSEGLVYLLAYTLGLCGTLLVVSIAGQQLMNYFGVASDPRGTLKRSVGVLFLLLGVAIVVGYDKKLELFVAGNIFDVTQIEQTLLAKQSEAPASNAGGFATSTPPPDAGVVATSTPPTQDAPIRVRAKAAAYLAAPEIIDPSGFVNTDGKPITIGEFKGKKVVLIDFWTYSCINCQRTLPYLKAWYDKYHDQGLEIISIHTPEFAFEKVQSNVEDAVKRFGLNYPVVLDNDYATWTAFKNRYWPRKYLIDIDGFVVYDHAGEGSYEETEQAIQKALAERATVLGDAKKSDEPLVSDKMPEVQSSARSPETYFGASRNGYLANGTAGQVGVQMFTVPAAPLLNALYLGGTWDIKTEYAGSVSNSVVSYTYNAGEVYIVGDAAQTVDVEVLQDGKPVAAAAGADVDASGVVHIKESRLYKLIHNTSPGVHSLELRVKGPGLHFYAFTFG